jgi:sensor domain CHASE-containing protein
VDWTIAGIDPTAEIDGLPTHVVAAAPPAGGSHDNGAVGLDHVVVTTTDLDRTAAALELAGMPLRRTVTGPKGNRMGFRRLGPAILELVEAAGGPPGAARFWGLVVVVADLDALASRLGDLLGAIRDAVQPGRRIATLRETAGLGQAVAFMSPEPR